MPKTKPHRREELRLHRTGHTRVAGVDEAGRGAWAGPLVAGAVMLNKNFPAKMINDSKLLTKQRREKMFVHITKHALSWAVAVVPAEEIDKIGLQEANRVAMERAVANLHIRPHAVLTDALPIRVGRMKHKAIIKGDQKVLSIAAASVVAKVVRDTLMESAHKRWPHYSFKMNKGYGTARHQAALKQHGVSPLHRRSFEPVRNVLLKKRRRSSK